MERIDKPSIFEANLVYLLLAMVLIFLGSIVQSIELYSGLLITQYIFILVPNIWFIKSKGFSLRKIFRLNKISIREIVTIILICIFAYPVVVFIQSLFLTLLNNFRELIPTQVPAPTDRLEYFKSFIIIAVTPGICEEIMFRGTILSAYDRLGARKSILISAILFGMFHFTILNFIGPAILGIIFGIIVHRTNSIYSSMIGHTVNNTIALTILYYFNKYEKVIDKIADESTNTLDSTIFDPSILVLLLFIFLCGFIVIKLIEKLPISETIKLEGSHSIEDNSVDGKVEYKLRYIPLLITVVIFIVFNWIFIFS